MRYITKGGINVRHKSIVTNPATMIGRFFIYGIY
jgi:hypothetical protein